MNTTLSLAQNKSPNYGVFTDISKTANLALGDQTGRTVSVRTANGLKNTLNLNQLSDDRAENIAHFIMVIAPVLLCRKNDYMKGAGIFLLGVLFVFYINGKIN